jgi:phage protein D
VPLGDETASELVVDVEGTPLSDSDAATLLGGTVTSGLGLPDGFLLRFSDADGALLARVGLRLGAKVRLSVTSNRTPAPKPLLEGEVTALEREVEAGALYTVVRGLHRGHRLQRGARFEAYLDCTIGDIVRRVAGRAGVDVSVAVEGPVVEHLSQAGVADWPFLTDLAAMTGAALFWRDGTLHFARPDAASSAPAAGATASSDPMVLEQGVNVLRFQATVTDAHQVPDVEVRGWDPQEARAVVGRASAGSPAVLADGVDPARAASAAGAPRLVIAAPVLDQPSAVDAAARAYAERVGSAVADVRAEVRGNPSLRAGCAVAVTGFGAPFDGRHTVSEVVHRFMPGHAYTTEVVVSGEDDRSLFGLAARTSGGAVPGTLRSAGEGWAPAVGIVSDIDDPTGAGRVRVALPESSDDYVSRWCPVVQAGAANARGAMALPEVGDLVLVVFEHGDIDRPVVLGGIVPSGDPRPGQHVRSGEVVRRSFTSRTGMTVEFDEDKGAECVKVMTSDGQELKITQNGDQSIQVTAGGPVKVTAGGDASVTARGAVALKGTSVSIEATTDFSVKATSVKITGTAQIEASAASVKVAGTATAELSASGMTTVRGATVRIN